MARARRTPAEATPPEITPERLEKLVRSGITSHSKAAEELGVPVSKISSLAWSNALVDGGEFDEIADTAAAVKRARDVEGNRWELIAARAGISVNAVKELYGGEDAAAESVISGRRSSKEDNGEAEAPPKRRGRPAKEQTGAATTGKRATAAATPRRARTRAERRAGRSNNPS
jgi:hypothetical protein